MQIASCSTDLFHFQNWIRPFYRLQRFEANYIKGSNLSSRSVYGKIILSVFGEDLHLFRRQKHKNGVGGWRNFTNSTISEREFPLTEWNFEAFKVPDKSLLTMSLPANIALSSLVLNNPSMSTGTGYDEYYSPPHSFTCTWVLSQAFFTPPKMQLLREIGSKCSLCFWYLFLVRYNSTYSTRPESHNFLWPRKSLLRWKNYSAWLS